MALIDDAALPGTAFPAPPAGAIAHPTMERLQGIGALSQRLSQRRTRGVYAQPASERDIQTLHAMMADQFEGRLATPEAACRIQQISPNSIWSVSGASGLAGGIAFLPLNALGVYDLIRGKLDLTAPPDAAIAIRTERPSVLYAWAMVARPAALFGLAEVLRQLDQGRFRQVDIWANAVTPSGLRMAAKLGLERFGTTDGAFFKFAREAR
jgi:hypothetical protein